MELTKDLLLSYDTVCLRPKFSYLCSRQAADTCVEFLGRTFKLPVIPANMRDVISIDNALWLSENEYFYIMHRFDDTWKEFLRIANEKQIRTISISIGTNNYKEIFDYIKENDFRVDFITIDVAHAHHENVEPAIESYWKNFTSETKLIVGNVATAEGAEYLSNFNVDAIKVGIGGGSICTTRYQTGFHLPTLQSVAEAYEVLRDKSVDIEIIADGGAKYYGDIAKALTFGATMIMSGGWFASCIDSPARIVGGKKVYRGSTSYEAKGEKRHIEGRTLELEEGITYSERLSEIKQALQSSISYAGGDNLSAFKFVEWARVSPNH